MSDPISIANMQRMFVQSEGSLDAKIAIVGEAPDTHDVRLRRPFSGQAGDLLNRSLATVGINRRDCYLTNVIKVQPPRDKITTYIDLSKNVPKITDDFYRYREMLKEELIAVNPNLIIAVGEVALFALTNQRKIIKRRGSILESILLPGVKILPILQPKEALRQYLYQHYIRFDLLKAKRESQIAGYVDDSRTYLLKPNFSEVMDFLGVMKKSDLVGFDIEVAFGHMSCISFAGSTNMAMTIPFIEGIKPYWEEAEELAIIKRIAELLGDATIKKVAQNSFLIAHFYCNVTLYIVVTLKIL